MHVPRDRSVHATRNFIPSSMDFTFNETQPALQLIEYLLPKASLPQLKEPVPNFLVLSQSHKTLRVPTRLRLPLEHLVPLRRIH
jgi:hypothetical protein